MKQLKYVQIGDFEYIGEILFEDVRPFHHGGENILIMGIEQWRSTYSRNWDHYDVDKPLYMRNSDVKKIVNVTTNKQTNDLPDGYYFESNA